MPSLWLTFDDGPDPSGTPRLLDLLQTLDARVTFFPIAPRAAEHPHLIARMLDEGHEVGLHCYEHVRHSERDHGWLAQDTTRALETLHSLGARPARWRTPWGVVAPWTGEIAAEHDLRLLGWTVDTHDWRGDSAQVMLERTQTGLEDGAVVLAHDGIGPGAQRDTATETIEFVRLVGAHARRHGLTIEARR